MDKVVYVLGAGFSAPLGLPVISNFRARSQDMFLEHPGQYGHFKDVFDLIKGLSASKNFYETDLYNIEEILSILEMESFLDGHRIADKFIDYIKDVIKYYTPEISPYTDPLPSNWWVALCGADSRWQRYGHFIAALLNLQFSIKAVYAMDSSKLMSGVIPNFATEYSIITLNYDLIPEMLCDHWSKNFAPQSGVVKFNTANQTEVNPFPVSAKIAKLHGSLDTGVIVPPTWSKGTNEKVIPDWKLAYQLLSEATHIRIIGFSLPVGDAYIKYLFKSAALKSDFLKKIDVMCMDWDGTVKARYDDFIKFKSYRFVNSDVTEYLMNHDQYYDNRPFNVPTYDFDQLERAHEAFMVKKMRSN